MISRPVNQTPFMLVYVTSAYSDAEPIGSFLRYAALDETKRFRLTDSVELADIILFVENSRYHGDYFYRKLSRHALVKQYPQKVFMYNPHDKPWLVLPGLYASMPAKYFKADYMAASPYVERINPYIRYEADVKPRYLFSFIGSPNSAPRRAIMRMADHRRALVRSSAGNMFAGAGHTDEKMSYAEVLLQSKFVLCPRGAGTSSFRLFETMQAGRVPVIIADQWVAPQGPDWSSFALFVAERDVPLLPRLLAREEENWSKRAKLSREAWEQFFAPEVLFDYLMGQVSRLKKCHQEESLAVHTQQYIPFIRYAFRALVIQKVKMTISALAEVGHRPKGIIPIKLIKH